MKNLILVSTTAFLVTLSAESFSQDQPSGTFRFEYIDDTSLRVLDGDQPVLNYNFGVVTGENVPENERRRTRACYVHPVWDLDGEILTDDFPKDHYHHRGLFWGWPHPAQGWHLPFEGLFVQKLEGTQSNRTGTARTLFDVLQIEKVLSKFFVTDLSG